MSCADRPGIDYADDYCNDECGPFWDERTVKARKQQRCTECGTVIAPGERYEKATGIIESRFHVWKRCMVCVALQEMIANEMNICVPFGALADFCADHRDDEHPWLDFREWQIKHGNAAK